MKRLIALGAVSLLLVFSAWAANYVSSKSSTGSITLTYHQEIMTQAQAASVLTQLEKSVDSFDETDLRDILKREGVVSPIAGVIIERSESSVSVLLLLKASDEAAARNAATGAPTGKRKK